MNIDAKDQNPAQMLDEFKKGWQDQFGEPMSHEMCAGFIAGMAAGLGKAALCDQAECLVALLLCGDLAATHEQMESLGLL